MGGVLELQRIVGTQEFYQWIITSIFNAIIFSVCDVFLFTKLFNVNSTKLRLIQVILIESIFKMISVIFIPIPYYRAVHLVFTIILYKLLLKQKNEICILGVVINAITLIITEVVFSKIFCMVFSEVNTYASGMYNYKYKLTLSIAISICRFILYYVIKVKKITININDNLTKENRNKIITISIIGCMLIFINATEMMIYISNFPYSILLLDIISLIIYFVMGIQSVIRITKLEEMDEKIHNLETYNQTLSIMYDNIRGFRHDFTNFVQALNGYAQTNNIEGIKQMSKSLIKECKEVNNMGILDPNVINNSAVYSIVTNKYYLAQEYGISIDVESMIDFMELNISTYELCRILGILLDNAIDAAKECDEKIINVRFVKDNRVNRKLIIIENSYNNVNIDLDKIYEKGYSTKTENPQQHGLGLWTVRKILSKSNNLNLFTSKDKLFCQQLEIYENNNVT